MLNRNIITKKDQKNSMSQKRERIEVLRQEGKMPREGAALGSLMGDIASDAGSNSVVEQDTPASRITKYFPGEALAFFLAMIGILDPENPQVQSNLFAWAVGVILLSLIFNVLYLRRVWLIQRNSQIAVSSVALIVYIFATGGELVSSVPGYSGLAATFALVVVTAFLAFFEPPETPSDK